MYSNGKCTDDVWISLFLSNHDRHSDTDFAIDIVRLLYVDDALFFYKNAAAVDRLTKSMEDDEMLLREEATVARFIGVHIDRKEDGYICQTQKGLAERIVEVLNLNDLDITIVEI